jgi:hypothetical protein
MKDRYNQTSASDHLSITTTILWSNLELLLQRPTVNNGHYFWVPREVVVRKFECRLNKEKSIKIKYGRKKNCTAS